MILEQLIFSHCYGNMGSVSGNNFVQCFYSAMLFLFSCGGMGCTLNLERQGGSMGVMSLGNITDNWLNHCQHWEGAAPERRWIPFRKGGKE